MYSNIEVYAPTEEDAALLRGEEGRLLTNSQYTRELLPSINGPTLGWCVWWGV